MPFALPDLGGLVQPGRCPGIAIYLFLNFARIRKFSLGHQAGTKAYWAPSSGWAISYVWYSCRGLLVRLPVDGLHTTVVEVVEEHCSERIAKVPDDLFFGESFFHVQVNWTLKPRATQDGVDIAPLRHTKRTNE